MWQIALNPARNSLHVNVFHQSPLCAVLQHQQNHNYHTNYRYYVLQVFHV